MSTGEPTPITREAVERSIDQIDGVQASQVFLIGREVQEIHLLGTNTRPPKQVVRDVESLLLLQFNLRCDYRKISLVQLDKDKYHYERARPRFIGVDVTNGPQGRVVTVKMQANDQVHTSEVPISGDAETAEAVAQATLGAVQKVLDRDIAFSLDEIKLIKLGNRDVFVTCITAEMQAGEQTYLGSSFARGRWQEGVVRATLDAINRRLGALQST